jgi:hypothetical protein
MVMLHQCFARTTMAYRANFGTGSNVQDTLWRLGVVFLVRSWDNVSPSGVDG